MCRLVIFAALCISAALAATTTKPHHAHATHEPNENESFRFVYDGVSHKMLLVNQHNCYIFTLSDAEIAGVHTDTGIRAIELKLLNSLSTATVTATPKDQIKNHLVHMCGNHVTTFYMAAV